MMFLKFEQWKKTEVKNICLQCRRVKLRQQDWFCYREAFCLRTDELKIEKSVQLPQLKPSTPCNTHKETKKNLQLSVSTSWQIISNQFWKQPHRVCSSLLECFVWWLHIEQSCLAPVLLVESQQYNSTIYWPRSIILINKRWLQNVYSSSCLSCVRWILEWSDDQRELTKTQVK